MANNKSGFDNEDKIKDTIFSELNNNLQELIEYSFKNVDDSIICGKQAGQNKND